ncbi:MAG: STAS-like domain-containing protein [Methylobacter sp.]
MNTKLINIAKDFSDEPFGRFYTDGDYSGERFRKEYLLPALSEYDKVIVNLDGSEGYGSSFLEEAFGGLIRKHGFSCDEIKKRFEFISKEDESYIQEIMQYIDEAVPEE